MHSKKNIFYKGFVFVASLFAMMFFVQTPIKAAGDLCKVEFTDKDQYITLAGTGNTWSDKGIQLTGCSKEFKANNIKVNGVDQQIAQFVPSNFEPGHYTIEYPYTLDGQPSSIFRYVRKLDSNFDTSKNYSLGAFNSLYDLPQSNSISTIIDSYYSVFKNGPAISNFVVKNGSTFLVLTNLSGKELSKTEILYDNPGFNDEDKKINATQILNKGTTFYVIGNTNKGGVIQLINLDLDYQPSFSNSKAYKATSFYNGGYIDSNDNVYLVGKNKEGKPIVDIFKDNSISNVYLNNTKIGEYLDIVANGENLYAVGSYKKPNMGTELLNGLYTIIPLSSNIDSSSVLDVEVLSDYSVFSRIIKGGNSTNILFGETYALEITGNGVRLATNIKPGFSDAFVIEIEKAGKNIKKAGMFGTASNDSFLDISLLEENKYFVSGLANNRMQTLAYTFNKTDFSMTEDNISRQNHGFVNGAVKLGNTKSYGYAYFGKINADKNISIMDVYYPHEFAVSQETDYSDPMLLILDNRVLKDETDKKLNDEKIILTVNQSPSPQDKQYYTYAHYIVKFAGGDNKPKEAEGSLDKMIPSDTTGTRPLNYVIKNKIGGTIYLYRTIEIVEKIPPIDLKNSQTGILKWYVYDRAYQYKNDNGIRLDPKETERIITIQEQAKTVHYTSNFKYIFQGEKNKSNEIFKMIENYLLTGNTNGFIFKDGSIDPSSKVFANSSQTQAAFSTVEYAKMFAYYQEFSRVVRIDAKASLGLKPSDLGATIYNGQDIPDGSDVFYIYYIDLMGKNGEGNQFGSCQIINNVVTGNCTSKAGYAFKNLNSINEIIKGVIEYNNFFITKKNTIYNGSVPASEIEKYKQTLNTKEYLKYYEQINNTNLTKDLVFNVKDLNADGKLVYQGKVNDVYFGGKVVAKNGSFDITNLNGNTLTNLTKQDDYYIDSVGKKVVITKNSCYEVYYSDDNLGSKKGTSKKFCLDTEGPTIVYHKEEADVGNNDKFHNDDAIGSSNESPAYISSDFRIIKLEDLDDYAYIRVDNEVFPNKCGEDVGVTSQECLNNIEKHIKQTFRYYKPNQRKIHTIEFRDRVGNSTKFYFVVGTVPPTLTKTETQTVLPDSDEKVVNSFVLHINFYETNSIGSFSITNITRQDCSESGCNDLYNDPFTLGGANPEDIKNFNQYVTNYIHAVSYRDRADINVIETIEAKDGIYVNKLNGISYKIIDNKFVEVEGYPDQVSIKLNEAVYTIDQEEIALPKDFFVRNEVVYYYNENTIQAKDVSFNYGDPIKEKPKDWADKWNSYYVKVGEAYVINDSNEYNSKTDYYKRELHFSNKGDAIRLNANNEFKFFGEDTRNYKIIVKDDFNYLKGLPNSYDIDENNTFRIPNGKTKVIYSYDPKTTIVSYANPEALISKRIDISFNRSIKDNGVVSIGVSIPKTKPRMKDGEILKDPVTLLPIYEIIEGENYDYKIVDGLYQFRITQAMNFGNIPEVDATIHVTKLELNVGQIANPDASIGRLIKPTDEAYTLPGNLNEKKFDFTSTEDEKTYVHLNKLDESLIYPIAGLSVLSGYSNTHFTDRSVFVGFTNKVYSLFKINVYSKKSDYGLPIIGDRTCTEYKIYSPKFSDESLSALPENDSTGCEDFHRIMGFDNGQAELKNSEIYKTSGGYIFSKDNTFFTISLVEYNKTDEGFIQKTEVLKETFYIDSEFDTESIKGNVSVGSGNDDTYAFQEVVTSGIKEKNNFELVKVTTQTPGIVGGTNNLIFDIKYYYQNIGESYKSRENKLLLLDLYVDDKFINTCNVFQVLQNKEKALACSNGYIDSGISNADDSAKEYKLGFSKSGKYKVVFKDASGNSASYGFSIDKSAPTIKLTLVNDTTGFEFKDGKYQVSSFVQNPTFTFRIEDDLSYISKYEYRFKFKGAPEEYINWNQVNIAEPQRVVNDSITMAENLLKHLNDSKFDGNVILEVRATDDLDNLTSTNLVVEFWVDYVSPELTFEKNELNEKYVEVGKISGNNPENKDYTDNTITILSADYVNKTYICEDGKFQFKDSRSNTGGVKYTFTVNCKDTHNNLNTDYSYHFPNYITMKFYEANGIGQKTSQEFKFGTPTDDKGNARWIYITAVDMVGNEFADGIYLPIKVADMVAPQVVENGVQKCVDSSSLECNQWEPIKPNEYTIKGEESLSKVYASNKDVKVTFSEYISSIDYCVMKIFTFGKDEPDLGECELTGSEFEYSSKKLDFIFKNKSEYANKTIVFKFKVVDFAGLVSKDEVTIVIDNIVPIITDEKLKFDVFEYAKNRVGYDDNHDYKADINIKEDQDMGFVKVEHSFYRYAPFITYNNYTKSDSGFTKVPSYLKKQPDEIYYLKVKKANVPNDKKCIGAHTGLDRIEYCYVEDVPNTYYFNELLNINSSEAGDQIWTTKSLDDTTIDRINHKTKIGVYKIEYKVIDAAGNESESKYKLVFVSDTSAPGLDIYNTNSSLKYKDITKDNPDEFNGKLNKSVKFVATDTPTDAVSREAKVLFYKCSIEDYNNDTCNIDSDKLYQDIGYKDKLQTFGGYNAYTLNGKGINGIYKAFVYDAGGYVENKDTIVNDDNGMSSEAYILTKNIATASFAIKKDPVKIKYTIHGNRFTNDHSTTNVTYKEDKENYIEIENGLDTNDARLVIINPDDNSVKDVSRTDAIREGNLITVSREIKTEAFNNGIILKYQDEKGRVVYQEGYDRADLTKGFRIHESYYYIADNNDIALCNINVGFGKSLCEEDEAEGYIHTYVMTGIKARIYKDGNYDGLSLIDNYGTSSIDTSVNGLKVDNTPFTKNKDEYAPTGINYWFSAPSAVVNSLNKDKYSQLKVNRYEMVEDRPADWSETYLKYYIANLDGTYSENTNPEFIKGKVYKAVDDIDSNVNVYDEKYKGNFNSSFFYTFASLEKAKEYMKIMYHKDIESRAKYDGVGVYEYEFTNAFGESRLITSPSKVGIENEIADSVNQMIISTFTRDKKYDPKNIKQVEYVDSKASSDSLDNATMYQYAYLLRTRKGVTNSEIKYDYKIAGDTCIAKENQECIKVNLKILTSNNSTISINKYLHPETGEEVLPENRTSCVSVGLGKLGVSTDCDTITLTTNTAATIIYIDEDIANGDDVSSHINTTYFGVKVYSDTTSLEYVELGRYIPLSQDGLVTRYNSTKNKKDPNGDYLWIDNSWLRLSDIKNTNLYVPKCEFNGSQYNQGCVYVTYLPRYMKDNQLSPSVNGSFYYDYNTKGYSRLNMINHLLDSHINNSEQLKNPGSREVRYGFNDKGGICKGKIEEMSCRNIPLFAKATHEDLTLGANATQYRTNKKSYIELFNTSNEKTSQLFELNTIVKNGKFAEVYSYATLEVEYSTTGVNKFFNINDNIIHTKGYSRIDRKPDDWVTSYTQFFTKDSVGNYVAVPQGEGAPKWEEKKYYINDVVEYVIDIPLESVANIKITDSANNTVSYQMSHTSKTPIIDYAPETEETNSDLNITIKSNSNISDIHKEQVQVYKYDEERGIFEDISRDNTCYVKPDNAIENSLKFIFKYNPSGICSGIYKIKIMDSYHNSAYKEFIYNPYLVTNDIIVNLEGSDLTNNIYTDENNLIANKYFYFEVDSNVNYVDIYKYPALRNGELDTISPQVLKITDFTSPEINFNDCPISISNTLGGSMYGITIDANSGLDSNCNGIYKINIINKFSSKLADYAYNNRFVNLEGNNSMALVSSKPEDWGTGSSYIHYFYLDSNGEYVRVEDNNTEFVEDTFYTPVIANQFITNSDTGSYTIELDSIAPPTEYEESLSVEEQIFVLYLDRNMEKADEETTKMIMTSIDRKIKLTNTFVTITWGSRIEFSLASLYYREVKTGDEEWYIYNENVGYGFFNASFEFAPIDAGIHTYEFKFVDGVKNENALGVYTIEIEIIPPQVGFFEILVDENGHPKHDNTNEILPGRKYAQDERIANQTILKCIGDTTKNCKENDYDYYMTVNGNNYYEEFFHFLNRPISNGSDFLIGSKDEHALELYVNLKVTVKGKPDIFTELRVVIDKLAPTITIDGKLAEGTTKYVGNVTVSVDANDTTNEAKVYMCDYNPSDYDNKCLIADGTNEPIENKHPIGTLDDLTNLVIDEKFSGHFLVVATDDPINLGNKSYASFTLDNEAPSINLKTENGSIAPNMYTNAEGVMADVFDRLTTDPKKNKIEVVFTALHEEDKPLEETMEYDSLLGFNKEGKYVVTPIDEVGHRGESITFYIYRQAPKYKVSGEDTIIKKDIAIYWKIDPNELVAPIVNVTVNGKMYNAIFNNETKQFDGEVIKTNGQHTFVLTDAAGNRSVIMATISDSNKVCVNGNLIDVKMQAYYNIDKLYIGKEEGVDYAEDDVIIYALPSQTTGSECTQAGALGYRTLDEKNSFFWISNKKNANLMKNNKFDFVKSGYISQSAIREIKNIGGSVVVFVVPIDVANNQLGYQIGTNFFTEDPLGWTMIFMSAILCLIPSYRIFIKKKVKII